MTDKRKCPKDAEFSDADGLTWTREDAATYENELRAHRKINHIPMER